MALRVKTTLRLAGGKIRRFLLVRFRRGYVSQQTILRQGECAQCGNCCEILFRCPFLLRLEDETTVCSIYDNRPRQCAAFPVDRRCLADVDFNCNFTFLQAPPKQNGNGTFIELESRDSLRQAENL